MEKTALTAKSTLPIPFALRERYGLSDGTLVVLIEQADGILIKKLDTTFFDGFLGKHLDAVPNRGELYQWSKEEIAADEARHKTLP